MNTLFLFQKEQILLFSNGVLKMPGENEPVSRPKKWPLDPLLAPDAKFIPGTCIEGQLTSLEDGDLTTTEVPRNVSQWPDQCVERVLQGELTGLCV